MRGGSGGGTRQPARCPVDGIDDERGNAGIEEGSAFYSVVLRQRKRNAKWEGEKEHRAAAAAAGAELPHSCERDREAKVHLAGCVILANNLEVATFLHCILP